MAGSPWIPLAELLRESGRSELAAQVNAFARRIPAARSRNDFSVDELVG